MRLLGIDYGTKRIGLALSDEAGRFAFPHGTFDQKAALNEIGRLCREEGVGRIVIGESVNLDGSPNPVMRQIESFKVRLEESFSVPVVFEKEYFTSREAERVIGKGDPDLDARAAALILKSHIDRIN